jgi:HicB family
MDLGPHLDAILGDVEALAGADEATATALERLHRPLEASIQLRLLDVLGEASLELGEQLAAGHVEVRVAGRDAGLVYVGAPPEQEATPAEPAEDEGETARLTLRMPDSLKNAVEAAAAADGVSVNAWLVRAVKRALDRPPQRMRASGNRIKGYARS